MYLQMDMCAVCVFYSHSTGSWELFLSVLRDSVICEQASSGKELCLSSREQQKRWNQKSYNPPMESNVDAVIPIGYITLSNLLFVFFKFYPLYSLKDVGMLVAIFF